MSHITNQRPLHTSSIVIYLSHSIYQNTPHYIRIILIDWLGLVISHQFLGIQNIKDHDERIFHQSTIERKDVNG